MSASITSTSPPLPPMLISGEHLSNRFIVKIAYNTEEASAALGISARSVRELIATGKVRAKRVAGRWLIKAVDLERLLG